MRKLLLVTFVVVLEGCILTLRAALATPTALPSPSSPDACNLVAQADAGQIVGSGAQLANSNKTLAGKFCRYRSSDHKMNIFVQNINPQVMKALPKLGATAVPNLGDVAYLFRGSIFVQKGKNAIQINVYSNKLDGVVHTPELMSLAKLAVSRM